MKFWSIVVLALFCIVFPTVANAQPEKPEKRVALSNAKHYVSYEVSGDDVIITMESIADFTDDRVGVADRPDKMAFDIDVNQNGIVDKDVDFGFAMKGDDTGICPHFMVSENSTRPCGSLRSKARVETLFEASPREPKPHPVFRYIISKAELLRGGDTLHAVFRFYHHVGLPYSYPQPKNLKENYSFAETLKLTF